MVLLCLSSRFERATEPAEVNNRRRTQRCAKNVRRHTGKTTKTSSSILSRNSPHSHRQTDTPLDQQQKCVHEQHQEEPRAPPQQQASVMRNHTLLHAAALKRMSAAWHTLSKKQQQRQLRAATALTTFPHLLLSCRAPTPPQLCQHCRCCCWCCCCACRQRLRQQQRRISAGAARPTRCRVCAQTWIRAKASSLQCLTPAGERRCIGGSGSSRHGCVCFVLALSSLHLVRLDAAVV